MMLRLPSSYVCIYMELIDNEVAVNQKELMGATVRRCSGPRWNRCPTELDCKGLG